jgi:predicted ATP-grasp superfamily ATP-dependent carboligase
MTSLNVMILDGDQRAALAVTRSLGKKGIWVMVGSSLTTSLAGSSRYASGNSTYRSPFTSPEGFIQDIKDTIRKHNIGMLLPITDITMYHVLKNADYFSGVKLPISSFEQYLKASNKMTLIRIADSLNVPVPKTIFVEDPLNIEKILPDITYPAVLKPQSSLIEHDGVVIKTVVKIVRSEQELRNALKDLPAFRHPFMVQEMVNGEGVGIFTLFHEGKPMAVFNHRRIREKPPWGGVSAVSESLELDPYANKYAFKLLEMLHWEGPAMIEFKKDNMRGVPVLMEINARFWGSLQLAIDAGVDFPYLLYLLAVYKHFDPVMSFQYTRLRWLLGDFDNLYITLKTPRERLPQQYHNKANVVWEFLKEFAGPARLEVLRGDDIRPFLWEFKHYIKDILFG